MSALMISTIKVKDPEKLKAYLMQVSQIGARFGAEMAFRGPLEGMVLGEADHQMVVAVRFPTTADIDALFAAPDYAPLIALREAAAEMTISKYEDAS